jgi:hypothetical protein
MLQQLVALYQWRNRMQGSDTRTTVLTLASARLYRTDHRRNVIERHSVVTNSGRSSSRMTIEHNYFFC